jgi:hypothetical protein
VSGHRIVVNQRFCLESLLHQKIVLLTSGLSWSHSLTNFGSGTYQWSRLTYYAPCSQKARAVEDSLSNICTPLRSYHDSVQLDN